MSGVSDPAPARVLEGGGCPDVTGRTRPDVPVSYPALRRDHSRLSQPRESRSAVGANGELDPLVVAGLVARAGDPKRERWLQQVRRTGACRHPVRLRGVVLRGDEPVYSTASEPDGALMVRCGNRREACCPSCAHEYRGDMWQLVYAGLAGGRKGVPEQVASHPQVFASLTAPSFGVVHSRPDDDRACRCGQRHDVDDPELGAAIDPATYDYEGAVLWNWHAPALWNRFMIELVRVLAGRAGHSEREWRQRVRVAYAKVAEFQARGLVHFHAIVRVDGAKDRATAPGAAVSPEKLCEAIREAAASARLDGDAGDGQTVDIRFGEQLHTRVLAGAEDGRELSPGQVAAYVAKYSCKSSHEQITSRDADPDRWRDRGVPEQLVQMAAAALRLSERAGLRELGRWVHMLGFRGHFVTKSRGYSTTLGELRAARAAYRARQDQPPENGEVSDDESTVVWSVWQYLGSGYLNPGDVLLAAGVEASLRAARDALLDLGRGASASLRVQGSSGCSEGERRGASCDGVGLTGLDRA
ncbi:MAG: replication initiator [Solirubrobacteraceae bacterium]